jgi:hypothetical protein
MKYREESAVVVGVGVGVRGSNVGVTVGLGVEVLVASPSHGARSVLGVAVGVGNANRADCAVAPDASTKTTPIAKRNTERLTLFFIANPPGLLQNANDKTNHALWYTSAPKDTRAIDDFCQVARERNQPTAAIE